MRKIIFIQHKNTVRCNRVFHNSVNKNAENGSVRITSKNTFYSVDYFWNNVSKSLKEQGIVFEVYLPTYLKLKPKGVKLFNYKLKPFNSIRETVRPFAKQKVSSMIHLLEVARNHYGFNLSTPNGFCGAVRFVNNSVKQN